MIEAIDTSYYSEYSCSLKDRSDNSNALNRYAGQGGFQLRFLSRRTIAQKSGPDR